MDATIMHCPESGCLWCPFDGDEFNTCQALRNAEYPDGRPTLLRYDDDPVAPDWCPLRSGSVTVRSPLPVFVGMSDDEG